jgi:hypothetical protein
MTTAAKVILYVVGALFCYVLYLAFVSFIDDGVRS